MPFKIKKLRSLFIIYWFLLAYIIAALIWWFIALNVQNQQMLQYKMQLLDTADPGYPQKASLLKEEQKRKTAQYIGEGATFLLLTMAGAVFVFRAVRRQLRDSQQQQNFMMALTHELKTPIAVAKLNLETLQKRKLEEAQQKKLIQNTLQEANRLNALCNNMLLASQIEAGGYRITDEETNFTELVSNCIQDFRIRFPQREIQSSLQEELFIMGDRLLLQMAVNNLIDNAIKYSPKGSPVSVLLVAKGNQARLEIRDEGKGISAEEKKKVFQKYYRVGNTATKGAKGTGLGLYLTKMITVQLNANISVTDNTPTGAIFAIALPLSTEKN